MGRVRLDFQHIWNKLGDHFVKVSNHKNFNVVLYCIDSYRQLADKFIQKEEGRRMKFQKSFLDPFELIIKNTSHQNHRDIKEYVVMCMAQLVHQKSHHIKSGWEVILAIFASAAQQNEMHLVAQSFNVLEQVTSKNFDLFEENFDDLIRCLTEFTKCNSENDKDQIQNKSLNLLVTCGAELGSRPSILDNFKQQFG